MKSANDFKSLKLLKSSLEHFKRERAESSWAARRDFSGIVGVEPVKKFEFLNVKVQVIDSNESKNSLN